MNKQTKLVMERIGKDSWIFVWPEAAEKAQDYFFDGLEHMERGETQKATALFNKGLSIFPEHIDILHHLSMMVRPKKESYRLLLKAVRIGQQAFANGFDPSKHHLEWVCIENRPFLRAYHGLGLKYLYSGNINKAIKCFEQIIVWNPNDNQGVRMILADIYVNREMFRDMIHLGRQYPDDINPSLTYGYALALFKIRKEKEAKKALKEATRWSPLCAKELLKIVHKKPKDVVPGFISSGGEDEAYEFWKSQGKSWKEKEVKEWLADTYNVSIEQGKTVNSEGN